MEKNKRRKVVRLGALKHTVLKHMYLHALIPHAVIRTELYFALLLRCAIESVCEGIFRYFPPGVTQGGEMHKNTPRGDKLFMRQRNLQLSGHDERMA